MLLNQLQTWIWTGRDTADGLEMERTLENIQEERAGMRNYRDQRVHLNKRPTWM